MKKFGSINVFGWKIPVFRLPGLETQGLFGFYDSDEKYIGINDTLSEGETAKTLMHEMFHAAFDRLHINAQLDEKFVEIIVENMTIAVFENFDVKRK